MHPEFPLDDDLIYLNHAAVAPWPRRAVEAVRRFADENLRRGAADYPRWLVVERRLKGRLARLIHASGPADVALVKNTSEGLSLIAHGLEWRAGENVVSTDREFPSNRVVWESLAPQGVELRQADLSGPDPEGAIEALVDAGTRLVSVSSVQFGAGLALDLSRLGAFCRKQGVLFCVDAIQSLGALRFDVGRCRADFVVADGHKWMLGPEGLALFYVRPEARERLRLHQFGWHMLARAGDFDRREWEPAADARRFEPGSPNMLAIHALEASLSLLEEEGMERIEAAVRSRAARLIEVIDAHPALELLTPAEEGRYAGIVTFRRPGVDAGALYRRLMKAGVVCAARGGGIRFSPHFHTDPAQLERAVELAATL